MPNYNNSKFIGEAIESVLAQSYDNFELIIIDDNSTDNSLAIIQSYIKKDNRIKLITLKKNSGTAFARNKGIELAKGKYISFLDSDDLWLPHKLEKQIKFMKNQKMPLTYSSYFVINEEGKEIGLRRIPESLTYKILLKSNFIGNLQASMIRIILVKCIWKMLNMKIILYGLNY